jgi:hypothetical protein
MAFLVAKLSSPGSKRVWMKLDTLSKRLDALEARITPIEATAHCPHCQALDALNEEELDSRIKAWASGRVPEPQIPEPSPYCKQCQENKAKLSAMSEEEIDRKLERLLSIFEDYEEYRKAESES